MCIASMCTHCGLFVYIICIDRFNTKKGNRENEYKTRNIKKMDDF